LKFGYYVRTPQESSFSVKIHHIVEDHSGHTTMIEQDLLLARRFAVNF
jgi:hypothetical protein